MWFQWLMKAMPSRSRQRPHMTVASLSAVRQRLGRPLRAQSVSAEGFVRC